MPAGKEYSIQKQRLASYILPGGGASRLAWPASRKGNAERMGFPMALRNILTDKDPALHKVCRPVTEFNERLWTLLDDMVETLYHADGVGLAAPQVGVLRRAFVMDLGDGNGVIEVINPEYLTKKGKQEGTEGCLSCPGEWGIVRRPRYVKIKAQDRYGKEFVLEGEDLLARCICHESDHLDGVVFKDIVVRMLAPGE